MLGQTWAHPLQALSFGFESFCFHWLTLLTFCFLLPRFGPGGALMDRDFLKGLFQIA